MEYPVTIIPDDNEVVLSFVDLNALTCGDDLDEALLNAVDALETAIEACIKCREPVPAPSKAKRGQRLVKVPAQTAIKVLLWNEMHSQGLRKADMAIRLDVKPPQVDRLFNVRHGSRIGELERAAKVLGRSIDLALAG